MQEQQRRLFRRGAPRQAAGQPPAVPGHPLQQEDQPRGQRVGRHCRHPHGRGERAGRRRRPAGEGALRGAGCRTSEPEQHYPGRTAVIGRPTFSELGRWKACGQSWALARPSKQQPNVLGV